MSYEVNYSALDRLIHLLAFSAPSTQFAAAEIERLAFGAAYRDVPAARPIFVTSLPRAGTTLMLEALHRFPTLASHVYRDMPFILAPVLWDRFSGPFRRRAELRERAHGDGMQVGQDSPEAFEEVLWRAFWPEKYSETGITPWCASDGNDEARAFFAEHMKKIVALRRPLRLRDGRYVSKNNANIARLDLLPAMFPDAEILVPLRHPVDHAGSLVRQHRNFAELHACEPFIRRYMADLGHYEFGALCRPIEFPGLAALTAGRDPLTIDYWLGYWIAAFEYLRERRGVVTLVSYEALCADPTRGLAEICARLDIADQETIEPVAALFRPVGPAGGQRSNPDPGLRDRAEALYESLVACALPTGAPSDRRRARSPSPAGAAGSA